MFRKRDSWKIHGSFSPPVLPLLLLACHFWEPPSLQFHTKKGKTIQLTLGTHPPLGGRWRWGGDSNSVFSGSCRPLFPLISIPLLPQNLLSLLPHPHKGATAISGKKRKLWIHGEKLVQYTGTNNGAPFRSKDPVYNSKKMSIPSSFLHSIRTSKCVLYTACPPD